MLLDLLIIVLSAFGGVKSILYIIQKLREIKHEKPTGNTHNDE